MFALFANWGGNGGGGGRRRVGWENSGVWQGGVLDLRGQEGAVLAFSGQHARLCWFSTKLGWGGSAWHREMARKPFRSALLLLKGGFLGGFGDGCG